MTVFEALSLMIAFVFAHSFHHFIVYKIAEMKNRPDVR